MARVVTSGWLGEMERESKRLRARVYETHPFRYGSARQRGQFEEACRALRTCLENLRELESPEFLQQVRAGEQPWRESALRFLEVDPWFFRSGYIKGKLARALKKVALTADELVRINEVLLAAVIGHGRPEFKEYCRLAVKVASPALRAGLEKAQGNVGDGVGQRARLMLQYLDRHGSAAKRT
jgi:hypothetical protein